MVIPPCVNKSGLDYLENGIIFCYMRTRAFLIAALLFSSLLFNGCFQIFYDIVQKPDGTFVIRQTVGLGKQFFQDLASFGSQSDSTHTPVTSQMIIDSMRHSFALRRDSLITLYHVIGTSGISSLSFHDTTIDTTTYFTMEATVTNPDSLPGAFHLLINSSNQAAPGSQSWDSDDVRLKVTSTKEWITVMFYVPPKDGGFMHTDIPGLEESFAKLALHYRVFSTTLKKPRDKRVKQIAGGQERVFGAKELFQKGNRVSLDATFAMKNTPTH